MFLFFKKPVRFQGEGCPLMDTGSVDLKIAMRGLKKESACFIKTDAFSFPDTIYSYSHTRNREISWSTSTGLVI